MSVAFKRFKVYSRGVIIAIVAVAIFLVLFRNRDHRVSFWFFGLIDAERKVNVVWLLLCTAVGTLVSRWVLSLGRGFWRGIREVKRQQAIDEVSKRLDHRAVELEERERRIDEKLRDAITGEGQPGDQ